MSNYCLNFNGTDHIVFAGDASMSFRDNDFTICLWVNFNLGTGKEYLFAQSNAGVNPRFHFLRVPEATVPVIRFKLLDGTTSYTLEAPIAKVPAKEWLHIAIVGKKTEVLKIYINGQLEGVSSAVFNGVDINLIGEPFFIGTFTAASVDKLNGCLDDFRMYNRTALTQNQIQDIYNAGVGEKVNETEFASLTSVGFYSNIDNYPDDHLEARGFSTSWTTLNSLFDIGELDIEWQFGGIPLLSPTNTSTENIQGMPIALAKHREDRFSAPNILMTSYIDKDIIFSDRGFSTYLTLEGLPLSVSRCYDSELNSDPSRGDIDNVGHFFAPNVIEALGDPDVHILNNAIIPSEITGNRLQVSKVDGNYYLNVVRSENTSTPMTQIIIQGLPLATGTNNELVMNRSIYNIRDVEEFKEFKFGGVPLAAGRIGNEYYWIVHPVANPS